MITLQTVNKTLTVSTGHVLTSLPQFVLLVLLVFFLLLVFLCLLWQHLFSSGMVTSTRVFNK